MGRGLAGCRRAGDVRFSPSGSNAGPQDFRRNNRCPGGTDHRMFIKNATTPRAVPQLFHTNLRTPMYAGTYANTDMARLISSEAYVPCHQAQPDDQRADQPGEPYLGAEDVNRWADNASAGLTRSKAYRV